MQELKLSDLRSIKGFKAASLVDVESGISLISEGSEIDIDLASSGNAAVLKTKRRVIEILGLNDDIEDIVVSLKKEYHMIRPLEKKQNIFLYLVLNRQIADLNVAKTFLANFERNLILPSAHKATESMSSSTS